MSGSPISDVAKTLKQAINSLPGKDSWYSLRQLENTLFNIIGFGSTHEALFTGSQACSGESKETALKHVTKLQADLGGTNLLSPLKYVFG